MTSLVEQDSDAAALPKMYSCILSGSIRLRVITAEKLGLFMSSSFMWGVLQNKEGENSLLLLALLSEEEEECISCDAQCRCELPQEMVMIVCCPSGGAAAGHFEDDEEDSAMMLLRRLMTRR